MSYSIALMDLSLTLLLLGCFQFVQQHRLCGRHPWSRQSAPQAMGAAGDRILLLITVDWLSLMALDLKGRGRWGVHMGFHFLPRAEKKRKPVCRERVGNKEVARGAERREGQSESSCFHSRWFPVSGSNPNLGPTIRPFLSPRRNPCRLPLDTCIGLDQS